MARRSRTIEEGQGSLFGGLEARRGAHEGALPKPGRTQAPKREAAPARTPAQVPTPAQAPAPRRWRMPALEGKTVAEIRLRWSKRLTPAQVARVEAELGALPKILSKLGFGPVVVERTFVRR